MYTRAYLRARDRRESSVVKRIKRVSVHVSFVIRTRPYQAIFRERSVHRADEQSERKEKKKYASDKGVGQCALLTAEVRFSEDNRSTYTRLARERAYTDQSHLQLLQH